MMMYKSLGNIATYINGYPFKPEDRGKTGLPIIRIQDLTGNAYDIGFYDGEYPSRIEINDGDILISWSASLGVYVWNRGRALLNQHIFKVVFDKAEVDKQYFVYAVQYKLKEMEAKTHGATMKHIIKKDFDNTLIPFPDVCEQTRIADKLSCVEKVIAKRKEQLKNLDELTKARFAELFGDPYASGFKFETCKLSEIATKVTDGEHGTVPRVNKGEGPLYIMARNITQENTMDFSELSYIPQENHNKIYSRCNPEKGDLLLVCVGATVGKVALVPDMEPFSLARSVALIKPDKRIVTSEFLLHLMDGDYIQNQIQNSLHAAAQAGLYTKTIASLEVFAPPMKLQEEFAVFVQAIDKSKLLEERQVGFIAKISQKPGR